MLEMIIAGGWLMVPILLCSVIAMGIVAERFWSLKQEKIVPANLVVQVWQLYRNQELDATRIKAIREHSPLGRVLAAGLINMNFSREVMKESIEETGRQVIMDLERFLNTLGTIASIAPLLGLLGTVLGMIKVFSVITTVGVGDPHVLAGGISMALITTAAGLFVAIPALMFHRYFNGRVDSLAVLMEREALKLVEVIHGEREIQG